MIPHYETSLRISSRSKINFARNNFDDGINELNNALKIQPELPLIWDELEKAYLSVFFKRIQGQFMAHFYPHT
jgi:hypothetical protein